VFLLKFKIWPILQQLIVNSIEVQKNQEVKSETLVRSVGANLQAIIYMINHLPTKKG